MKKLGFIFFIFHFSFSPSGAQSEPQQGVQSGPQHVWTLDECMDYAIEHNTNIMHLQNEQKRREVKLEYSKNAHLPRINADMGAYSSTVYHSSNFMKSSDNLPANRLNTDMLLLNMGLSGVIPINIDNRQATQVKADNYALMASTEDIRNAERNLRIMVAAAYLQVLYYMGETQIARQRLDVSQLLLKRAQSLFDRGSRPESDVVEASAMVSRDEAMLAAAEGEKALSQLDLRQLLNLPDSVTFDISEPADSVLHPIPTDTPNRSPFIFHPALLSGKHNIMQAEQLVKMTRYGYYPSLSVIGQLGIYWTSLDAEVSYKGQLILPPQLGYNDPIKFHFNETGLWERENFLQAMVGLKLSIPVFNAFETKSRIRAAKVNLMEAQLSYYDTHQQLHKNIQQAWQGALTAHKRYEAESKAEAACALSYQYALKRYEAGVATLFDLSESRQQWFTAAENALHMKYEYLIKKRIYDIQTQE